MEYVATDTELASIADAIRTKGGTTAPLEFPDGFIDAVEAIETGGGGHTPVLQSKTLTLQPTTAEQNQLVQPDSGYDGLSSVDVTVGAIPSQYIVPQGSQSIAENGTYDVTALASVVVNVAATAGRRVATGTYTPPELYNTTGNRLVTTTTEIGFTPSIFILQVHDRADLNQERYALLWESFAQLGDSASRIACRYSNTSGTIGAAHNTSSWTTQSNYYLYFNGSSVYVRTTSAYLLPEGVLYDWIAIE